MKILLVEDHESLRKMVEEHLTQAGFVVDAISDGEDALEAVKRVDYDGMILDLGLPSLDGMKVIERVRMDRSRSLPIVVMTARDDVGDRIRGLNSGADDYVVKPFDMLELEARLRAVLRRPGARSEEIINIENLVVDIGKKDVRAGGNLVDLARRELALLEELIKSYPGVVAKDRLEDKLYTFDEVVTSNAIEAAVSRLRKKLEAAGASVQVSTVRGIGYRLLPDGADEVE